MNINDNVVCEVIEVDTKDECNKLLNSGYYIFLNSYVELININNYEQPIQQIHYCLGKLSYY